MRIVRNIFWFIIGISFVCQLLILTGVLFLNNLSVEIFSYLFIIGALGNALFCIWIILNFIIVSLAREQFNIAIALFVLNFIIGWLLLIGIMSKQFK